MEDKLKIDAIVHFNQELAYVINRPFNFKYTQIDRNTIVGDDNGFYRFYFYETPSEHWKAFGGAEFKLELTSGEIINCNGQWWDGRNITSRKLYPNVVDFTCSNKNSLIKCYVFLGGIRTELDTLDKLKSEYKGKIYEYYEYEKEIKQ